MTSISLSHLSRRDALKLGVAGLTAAATTAYGMTASQASLPGASPAPD